jgi:YebC/PmpR family DNA-binding regulatory protein
MAGHSKWANIKHKKSKTDAARGKIFTKLIREITTAARRGGGDIDANPWLRLAVDKAYAQNMKKDTVDRAIKRGAGGDDADNLMEIRYEGYGPGGVAVMVDCLTDNKNRTVAEVRHAFTKCGGNLGTDGSVAYLFTKTGLISFAPGADEDAIMEAAIEAGALDVTTNDDGSIDVTTDPEELVNVKSALEAANLKPTDTQVTMIAATTAAMDVENAEKMLKLNDMLEELDDVQEVYSNADISDEVMAQLN